MIYGYMRVSTTGQTKGNSFDEQERLLRKNGATEFVSRCIHRHQNRSPQLYHTAQQTTGRGYTGDYQAGPFCPQYRRRTQCDSAFIRTRRESKHFKYGYHRYHAYRETDSYCYAGFCRI